MEDRRQIQSIILTRDIYIRLEEALKAVRGPFAITGLVTSRVSVLATMINLGIWWDIYLNIIWINLWTLPKICSYQFIKHNGRFVRTVSVWPLSLVHLLCARHCSRYKGSDETEETVSPWGAHRAIRETGEQQISRQSAMGSNDMTECSEDSEKERIIYSCQEDPTGARTYFCILKNE